MPRSRRALLLVLLGAAAVYLAGNGMVGLWDRDEPRYAQTSRQMVQSGDWIVPMYLDAPRTAKPIFIYWCQASAMKLLGQTSAFAARIPSAIAGVATLIIVALSLRRAAIWTTFILATTGLFIGTSKMCMTDAVLLVWITLSQIGLYLLLRNRLSWWMTTVVGAATGLAILTKGPVVLGVSGMTLIAWFLLRPRMPHPTGKGLVQVLIVLLLAGGVYSLWGIPIERRIPNYHRDTINKEILDRAGKPAEGHKGPPGYYLLTIWATYLPWSLLIPGAIYLGWKRRRDPKARFALASIIGPWIMFEIVQTKLPHYLLPVFPPLAYLTARWLLARKLNKRVAIVTGASMWLVVVVLYVAVLPNIPALRISQRVSDVLIKEGATTPGSVLMIDYKEPSLAFHQGGTIREQRDNAFLQHEPESRWPRWIVLTDVVWNQTPPEIRDKLDEVARVHGWAYADGGRTLDVIVVRKKG